MKNIHILIKVILSIIGIIVGRFIAKTLSIPPFRPNRYVEIHDNRGISSLEALLFVVAGAIFSFVMMAILRYLEVI